MSPLHDILKKIHSKLIKYQPIEKLLMPHRINPPPGYAALLEVPAIAQEGLIIAEKIYQMMLSGKLGQPTLERTVVTINYMLIREGMPIYFVNEDFIRAVAATELPDDIKVEELYWPKTAFVLAFPQRFMLEYINQDISYVTVANVKKGEYSLAPMMAKAPTMEVPLDKFCVHSLIWNTYQQQPENTVVAWWQSDFINQAAKRWAYTDMCGDTEIAVKYKKESNDLLGNLVLKLLLILSTNVSYVTEGHKIREEKRDRKGRIEQHELWGPNLIGGAYRIKGKREGGTYTPHEGFIKRSGHFTHQFIGKREDYVSTDSLPKLSNGEIDWALVPAPVAEKFWANHKRMWIQPVWYNPAEAK